MYKRILVAIDGSRTSLAALREALKLAVQRRTVLRIVHVVDLVNLDVERPYDLREYEASVRKAGQQILKRALAVADRAGVKSQPRLLEVGRSRDRVAEVVAREARSWRAELLVIGTHGHRGFSRLFLGSVAESVIRIAPAPVLVVRGR
jgi:nucleotide-binding universal stress UspA family protein